MNINLRLRKNNNKKKLTSLSVAYIFFIDHIVLQKVLSTNVQSFLGRNS